MGLFAFILKIVGSTASGLKIADGIKKKLQNSNSFENVLVTALGEAYKKDQENLERLSKDSTSIFNESGVATSLAQISDFNINTNDELESLLLPILRENISIVNRQENIEQQLETITQNIAKEGINKFWIIINDYDRLTNLILVSNTKATKDGISELITEQAETKELVQNICKILSESSTTAGLPSFDSDKETATPLIQEFDNRSFINPFALVRSEDFNHNYSKLATLFQSFTEWASVQSRTTNVFIVGGRGTGKSMILRRMSIQTIISDYHNKNNHKIKLSEISEDYYGIYIKLIRGQFDQYENDSTIPQNQSNYLAQHELNIKIIDSFRDSIAWLIRTSAITFSDFELKALLKELTQLFSDNITCNSLDELDALIKKEQKAIHLYFKNKTFELDEKYSGNASESAFFVSQLSVIFRKYFCSPTKDFRLILLIDEYEALAKIQQIAINNIIKNRLPDLTIKLAMRKDSVKSRDTFTPGEPIQYPRDYTTLNIDYESGDDKKYIDLLKGICAKRLQDSGYSDLNIENYLVSVTPEDFYDEDKIKEELENLWKSGNRKTENPTQEFYSKYRTTAIRRVYSRKSNKFPYFGFEQYKFLSYGIISNFLELCRYSFYFALKKEQNLNSNTAINPKIQNHSIYYVSEKLFNQIDGNVPEYGFLLKRFLTDLSSLIRTKLMKHTSETECNRIAITNYDESSYKKSLLNNVIQKANTWSVINYITADEAMGTKNESTPKPNEIIINRIYCPHLLMPPTSRWSIRIDASDLLGLLGDKHAKAYKKISAEIVSSENTEEFENNTLFKNNDTTETQ